MGSEADQNTTCHMFTNDFKNNDIHIAYKNNVIVTICLSQ